MAYSEWQLRRVRDSIHAHYHYRRAEFGERWGWIDIEEEIMGVTGVSVPYERLRQFVKGTSKKKNPVKKSGLSNDNLDAVVKFVTDESFNLLSAKELNEHIPQFQAPLRLIEYLAPAFEPEPKVPSDGLLGTYVTHKADEVEFVVVEISLKSDLENGLIQVAQIEDYYPASSASQYGSWDLRQKRKARRAQFKYGGWAILTPEDNLLFFMKKQESERNHYFFTLAFEGDDPADNGVTTLVLLHHDYPLESQQAGDTRNKDKKMVLNGLKENLLFFEKRT